MATTDRRLELGAFAAIPFGLAVVVYAMILKANTWRGFGVTILIGLGVGAVIAGFKAVRALPEDRVKPSYWLLGLAAIAPLALGAVVVYLLGPSIDHVALHDREVGSITIALPDGNETANPEHTATLMIERIGGFDVMTSVVWQFGTFDEQSGRAISEQAAAQVDAVAVPVPDDDIAVGAGMPHRSFRIAASAGPLWMTVFACGPRLHIVSVAGHDALGLQRRILATVRCRPDAPSPAMPAVIDLPVGWHLEESDPEHLVYQKDLEMLAVARMEVIADNQLQKVADGVTRTMGGVVQLGVRQNLPGSDGVRAVWTGSVTAEGTSVPFTLAIWPCREQPVALAASVAATLDEQSRMALLDHVRCARRGEKPSFGTEGPQDPRPAGHDGPTP